MSNPENPSRLEELAALHAVDLLDEVASRELLEAAQGDPAVERLIRDFNETAALLALEPPQVPAPSDLRQKILHQLPAAKASISVSFSHLMPYAIAACLMILGISEGLQVRDLKTQLAATREDAAHLRDSNALLGLRLATLDAKDAAYAASKIMVAWDPYQNRGVLAMENLPTPPPGKDYQLWVLDPSAQAPISAGLITTSRPFEVRPVGTQTPGFAISLEPSGGRPEPTGPILFAVVPGP